MSNLTSNQPEWITESLSPYDIAAINQGGCASGAYMPAVTYNQALETMAEHGNDVFEYLEENMGELPVMDKPVSWSGMAVFYLSCAVEMFCMSNEHLEDWNNEEPIDF